MRFEEFLTERMDELDNSVYALLRRFLMLEGEGEDDAFPWNMEIIGNVSEAIEAELISHGYRPCRPYYEGDERTPCFRGKDCDDSNCPLRQIGSDDGHAEVH